MKEEYYVLNEVLKELEESLHERSKITKNMKKQIVRLIRGYYDEKVEEIQYRLLAYLKLLRRNRNTISTCLRKADKALNTLSTIDMGSQSDVKSVLGMIHTLLSYALLVDFDLYKKILLKLMSISKNGSKYEILNENRQNIMRDYSELKGLCKETEKLMKEIESLINK